MHQEAFSKRQALTSFIQELPVPKAQDAIDEVAFALEIAGYEANEAYHQAMHILRSDSTHFTGSRDTCILQWSFKPASFWRGLRTSQSFA